MVSLVEQAVLHGHTAWIMSVCCNPTGGSIASGSWDGSVRVWDVRTGLSTMRLSSPQQYVRVVAFDPTGAMLASAGGYDAGSGGAITVWESTTGRELNTFRVHGGARALAFADRDVLAGNDRWHDHAVVLWDAPGGQEVGRLVGHTQAILGVTTTSSGDLLASASADGTVRVWHVATRLLAHIFHAGDTEVHSVSFSPTGTLIAAGLGNGVVMWDLTTSREVWRWSTGVTAHSAGAMMLDDLPYYQMLSLAFSPDGTTLAVASADDGEREGAIILFDVATGQRQQLVRVDTTYTLAFSPDGTILVSGGVDESLHLWR